MPKFRSMYTCQQCGFKSASFLGKCPQCESWNSFVEEVVDTSLAVRNLQTRKRVNEKLATVTYLKDVNKEHYQRISTSLAEFDRVLGGGIVKGSVVLVSGDPGVGKSTLLTQLALNINKFSVLRSQLSEESQSVVSKSVSETEKPKTDKLQSENRQQRTDNIVLYVAGEESAQQIKIRADRIKPSADFPVLNEVDVDVIIETIRSVNPTVAIIDSIQTITTTDLESAAGSVSQVRECSSRLQKLAKETHIPVILVGHVTKEGVVAGPRTLEHLVDVVLSLEGDNTTNFRILRANKNRFGSTEEVGIFDMSESGMKEVSNPSEIFLETKQDAPGSAIVPILTGLRPILVEIQALVTKTSLTMPRRTGSGIDNNRLQLLVAVLQKRLKLNLWDQDIFVNVTGGLKVTEPAADLAICMAIFSSFKDITLPKDSAFIGEVGLLGELRNVNRMDKRASEAKTLGYKNVISSEKFKTISDVARNFVK